MTRYTLEINDGAFIFRPLPEQSVQAVIHVPWLSQLGSTAAYSSADCGAAVVAMIVNWFGKVITVDEVSVATGKPRNYGTLSFDDVSKVGAKFGLNLKHLAGMLVGGFQQEIDAGRPVVALLNYLSIPPALRRDNSKIGHFVLAIGYDETSIFYHDPYWPDESHGANKRMSHKEFDTAFSTIAPGNSFARHALVIR